MAVWINGTDYQSSAPDCLCLPAKVPARKRLPRLSGGQHPDRTKYDRKRTKREESA